MKWQAAFIFVFAAVFGFYTLQLPTDDNPRYSTPAMINGTADNPFVTRALVPVLLRFMPDFIPNKVLALAAFTLFGWGFAMQWLASGVGKTFEMRDNVFALLGLPFFFLRIAHIGDLMTLLLTTLCLAALAHKKRGLYLALFALAVINRETAFLLIIIAAPFITDMRVNIAQLLIFVALRGVIMFAFAGNDGALAEWHWHDHIARMLSAYDLTILSACVVALTLSRLNLRAAHPLLRTAFIVTAPTLAVLWLMFGYPFEFRVFLEVYPVVVMMVVPVRLSDNLVAHWKVVGSEASEVPMPPAVTSPMTMRAPIAITDDRIS